MADTIIEELDATALDLLRRIRSDSNLTPEQSTIFTEQVKAFDTVARWATARTKLIVTDETKESAFAGIKRKFREHDAKGRRRRGIGAPAAQGGSAAVIEFPADSASSSPDSSGED